jgi:4-methylaminobutanoate oxidase (formaldehyde-forming)
VRASRITYVGELGWELYIPTEFSTGVFDAIVAAGEPFGLRHAGYHALNSLRMEKGYRSWGHDITPDDTPLEAGLGFAVAWNKPCGFLGREALAAQKEDGVGKRLVQFALTDPDKLLYHNEPVWRGDEIVGSITSGMFGHTIEASLGMGWVCAPGGQRAERDWVLGGHYEIEVAGERIPACASLEPWYDPKSARVRS